MIRFRAASAAELIARAREAPPGLETVELYRRAVVTADRLGDLDAGFTAREELISAEYHTDATVDQLVAFTWCINAMDRYPGRFAVGNMMWYYKWIVSGMAEVAAVPLALLDRLLEDMDRRYRDSCLGSAPVDHLRLQLAIKTGRQERLEELLKRWDENRDLRGSDCPACRQDTRVECRIAAGSDELALEEAEPLLASKGRGKLKCLDVPEVTIGNLLLPMLRTGKQREAASACKRVYAMVKGREGFVRTIGQQMAFLAIVNEVDEGLKLLQTHLREAMRTKSDYVAIAFWRGAWALCERARREGRTTLDLSLSPRFELFDGSGLYDTVELAAHFRECLRARSEPFDRRNGTETQGAMTGEVAGFLERGLKVSIGGRDSAD